MKPQKFAHEMSIFLELKEDKLPHPPPMWDTNTPCMLRLEN